MSEQVTVAVLPKCDFCTAAVTVTRARYDGKTVMGPWANMCEVHFNEYGIGLGTGRGQRLVLKSEAAPVTGCQHRRKENDSRPCGDCETDSWEAGFSSYMEQVDQLVLEMTGMSYQDFPDKDFAAYFDAYTDPQEVAKEVIRG